MMGYKIKNAYECEEKVKSKFDKSFEYVKRRFGQDMEFFDEYKKIMQGEGRCRAERRMVERQPF